MKRHRLTVEIDRSTLEWTVVEHSRHGWSVLTRHKTQDEAHKACKSLLRSDVPRLSALFPFGGR